MQNVHGKPAADDIFPGTHSQQFARLVEPAGADLPAAQLLHNVAPVTEEYMPSVQVVHCELPTAEENLPASQFAQLLEPSDDHVPAMQLLQIVDEEAPRAVENLPAMHIMQTVAPLSGI